MKVGPAVRWTMRIVLVCRSVQDQDPFFVSSCFLKRMAYLSLHFHLRQPSFVAKQPVAVAQQLVAVEEHKADY